MGGLESDTIGGYNAMLEKQKAVEGECHITTVLFDNSYELLHDRIDIKAVSPITEKEYAVGGSTALLDAIGRTIHKIGNAQKHTADDYRAERVMFIIITDGEENSSREYSADKVKAQIDARKQNMDGNLFSSEQTLMRLRPPGVSESMRTVRSITSPTAKARTLTSP
jgi:uncharacterized protein YegL